MVELAEVGVLGVAPDLGVQGGEVIETNGFQVDWPLWEKDFSKCTPCRPGSNCH